MVKALTARRAAQTQATAQASATRTLVGHPETIHGGEWGEPDASWCDRCNQEFPCDIRVMLTTPPYLPER